MLKHAAVLLTLGIAACAQQPSEAQPLVVRLRRVVPETERLDLLTLPDLPEAPGIGIVERPANDKAFFRTHFALGVILAVDVSARNSGLVSVQCFNANPGKHDVPSRVPRDAVVAEWGAITGADYFIAKHKSRRASFVAPAVASGLHLWSIALNLRGQGCYGGARTIW